MTEARAPERSDVTVLVCMKTGKTVSASEPRCVDPGVYCAYRAACVIQFLEKERTKGLKQKG